MTKRDVVSMAIRGETPPYVPWSFGFTAEAADRLRAAYGVVDLEEVIDNHIVGYGSGVGFFDELPGQRFRDVFGVVWNRSVDKDIGVVEGQVLPEPALDGYTFPDPHDERFFADIPARAARYPDRFRVFQIGFSLYERAWAMRGMTELLMDFVLHPEFVHELFTAIADYNIAQVSKALTYEIDAVYFGDDWGQQTGLDCFNPFQPEVMDVSSLVPRYRGRLAFHGGLSTQRTLPYCSKTDVIRETDALLELGAAGGYIFSPAHAVEGDVPVENMVAFIERAKAQRGE